MKKEKLESAARDFAKNDGFRRFCFLEGAKWVLNNLPKWQEIKDLPVKEINKYKPVYMLDNESNILYKVPRTGDFVIGLDVEKLEELETIKEDKN